MANIKNYSDDVLNRLIKKMEIEEETKSFEILKLEVENWEHLLPTIKISELEDLKLALEYQIYDLFNIKKLPIKYKETTIGICMEPKTNAEEYIKYYENLKALADKYKLSEIDVKAIKKKNVIV